MRFPVRTSGEHSRSSTELPRQRACGAPPGAGVSGGAGAGVSGGAGPWHSNGTPLAQAAAEAPDGGCTTHALPASAAGGTIAARSGDAARPCAPLGAGGGGRADPARSAPCWHQRYMAQHGYTSERRCPCCGHAGSVLPVVYGFPSPRLLGAHSVRLLLGGDHLLEDCTCWACTTCRACWQYYPYERCDLWLRHEDEQPRDGVGGCSVGNGGASGSGGGSRLDGANGAAGNGDFALSDCGLPRYTYEL